MNPKVRNMTRIGILLALTLAIQMMGLPQLVTGTAINAMLLIAAMVVGMIPAAMIGCVTPLVALMVGIIKPVMMPVVPFIMIANGVLVIAFSYFKTKNQYGALIVGAFAKFLVLWGAVQWVLIGMLPDKVFEKVAVTFGITQLFTALGGGIIALAVMPLVKNYLDRQNPKNM